MIHVSNLKPEDFLQLNDSRFGEFFTEEMISRVSRGPTAGTFTNEKGEVVMCAGIIEIWPGRAECWAIPNKGFAKEFTAIHRWVRDLLDAAPFNRIEAAVEASFENGHRWANMLGFEKESDTMRQYFPDGADAVLYARVK